MKNLKYLVVIVAFLTSCVNTPDKYKSLEDGVYAEILTNKGEILLALYAENVPMTVANFVSLAEGTNNLLLDSLKGEKFYEGVIFHRVVSNFVIQGGGFTAKERKNVGYTIKSFLETFKNTPNPPALVMKVSGSGASYIDKKQLLKRYYQIRKTVKGKNLPNVYMIHGELSNTEMNELYNHSKVKAMVSLTKGEGFGRPLLEFSLTDKPVIATGWSGHIDFLKREFSALMSGKLTPVHASAADDFLIKEAKWFSVDHGNIGHFLTDVSKNYKDWKVKAKKQGKYSRANFSFGVMKKQLADTLERNVPEIAKTVALKLPKLNLPKLKKVNAPKTELPKLKLPKLKKI